LRWFARKLSAGDIAVLVAITGADGAGKTTASRALIRELARDGIDAVSLDRFAILDKERCPSARFVSADIRQLRGHVLRMSASQRLLFILWSMSVTLEERPSSAAKDELIIYDSYWMKFAAAEIIYGIPEAAALTIAGLLPPPDITVYLRLSPEQSLERKRDDLVPYECGMDPACPPESFLRHQKRIQAQLDAWAERNGWIQLDAAGPVESVVAGLLGIIRPRLKHLSQRQTTGG
jgi:thymidylate kinase